MKTYKVSIEETVVEGFDIFADSPEEARSIAIAKYKRGDIVLEPGEIQYREIAVLSPGIDEPEWEQF